MSFLINPYYTDAANDWPVWTGANDGASTVIDSTLSVNYGSAKLDTDKIIFIYYNGTNGGITARIITTASTTPTPGAAFLVSADTGSALAQMSSLDVLSTTRVIVTYSTTSGNLKARVLSISGTTITGGTEITIDSSIAVRNNYVMKIDTDRCIVAYVDNVGGIVFAKCFTITGTTVNSPGASITVYTPFSGSGTNTLSGGALTSSTAIITYGSFSTLDGGKAIIITNTTGTTLVAGTEATFAAGVSVKDLTLAILTPTLSVINFVNYDDNTANLRILAISGTSITPGSQETYRNNLVSTNSNVGYGIVTIDSSTGMISFRDTAGLYGMVFATDGSTITTYTPVLTATMTGDIDSQALALIDESRILATYRNTDSSGKAEAIVYSTIP